VDVGTEMKREATEEKAASLRNSEVRTALVQTDGVLVSTRLKRIIYFSIDRRRRRENQAA
jgi:hypothetical protein